MERSAPDNHLALAIASKGQLIVLNDYQARTSHFPLQYSLTHSFKSIDNPWAMTFKEITASWDKVVESDPAVDYILLWGIPSGPSYCKEPENLPPAEVLKAKRDLVFQSEGSSRVQLWRRRG